MGNVAASIHMLLQKQFLPATLQVVDDSAKHAGHAGAREGGESHFSVIIVSEKFEGMSRVERHRAVYDALKPVFEGGLHALAITAKTSKEQT